VRGDGEETTKVRLDHACALELRKVSMDFVLTPEETRVLGCLIEKQITTPEYYPLTLNGLINACNQKSNRDPVVTYEEMTVLRALDALREKKLARMVSMAESRVAKYRQVFTDTANLTEQGLGLLCVLMLRGPQTVGELRTRTERLCPFSNLEEVEKALQQLIEREPEPLVALLPRQVGFKEPRYAQLLGGELSGEALTDFAAPPPGRSSATDRVALLEAEIESLRQNLLDLQQQFREFKKQFE